MAVYLYLLKHRTALGSSEVQRKLGLSTPSLAVHHLDKLISLGLVERNEAGAYVLVRKVNVGVLSLFIQFGELTLPRLGFFAGFFSGLTILYATYGGGLSNPLGLLIGVGASAVLWYETLTIWRSRPQYLR